MSDDELPPWALKFPMWAFRSHVTIGQAARLLSDVDPEYLFRASGEKINITDVNVVRVVFREIHAATVSGALPLHSEGDLLEVAELSRWWRNRCRRLADAAQKAQGGEATATPKSAPERNKTQRTRTVGIVEATHSAVRRLMQELGRKPKPAEVFDYWKKNRDDTGVIGDLKGDRVLWTDSLGKPKGTSIKTIGGHIRNYEPPHEPE